MSEGFVDVSKTVRPRIFATVEGNPRSQAVLERVRRLENGPIVKIFGTAAEAANADLSVAVVFFDGWAPRHFRPVRIGSVCAQAPAWAQRSAWGVIVGNGCAKTDHHAHCARYTAAIFYRNFEREVGKGNLPWGSARRKSGRSHPPGGYLARRRLKSAYAPRVLSY